MFCKNCGETLNENQAVCVKCGVKVGDGDSYCANCGKNVIKNATVCLNCGCALKSEKNEAKKGLNGQNKTTMALVCFFLGGIGIHNFMMGEKKKGIIKIVFSLLFGIGSILGLIDFIKILTDNYVYNPDAAF
ncbi:MAG: TM2 domain-containing protein [Clostridia bacterium]|nr:TM2 domain-containing protein [Clostridia bacterium]